MSGFEQHDPSNMAVADVWKSLESDPEAELIDVRTQSEWAFVGVCDLSSISKRTIQQEWLSYPGGAIDPEFVEKLESELEGRKRGKETKLFFICRSGQRSLAAANAMAQRGWVHCINVKEGFEGPIDDKRHRGGISGWKYEGLPWVQS